MYVYIYTYIVYLLYELYYHLYYPYYLYIIYNQGWTWRAKVDSTKGPLDTNPELSIYEWDNHMKPIAQTTVILQHTSITPHDFSVTTGHYVVIENRVMGNTVPYLLGMKSPAQCVEIISHLPMVLTIIKRPHALATTESSTTTTATTTTTTTTAIASSTSSAISSATSSDNNNDNSPEQFSVNLSPGFTIHSVCAFERNNNNNNDNNDDKHTIELYTTAWKSDVVASGAVKGGGLLGCWEGTAPVFENIPVTLL